MHGHLVKLLNMKLKELIEDSLLDLECIIKNQQKEHLLGSKSHYFNIVYNRIGSSNRGNLHNQNSFPGVGQYNLSFNKSFGPQYSMRIKTKEPFIVQNNPGPGNYTPNYNIEHKNNEKYTMRPKTGQCKDKTKVPGPGQYTIRNEKEMEKPSYIFSKDKKLKAEQTSAVLNPGPGNYQIENNDPTQQLSPKFSFGKEDRSNNPQSSFGNRAKTPGPGQYHVAGVLGSNAPKISISFVKPSMSQNHLGPGPGQYSYSKDPTMHKAPHIK